VKRLALTAVFMLVAVAPASGWLGPKQKSGDLAGDGSTETVRSVRVPVPGVTDQHFDATAVQIESVCNGVPVTKRIAGTQDNLGLLRLRNADGRKGREVFVDMRSGASARLGEARVVAWRKGSPCSRARQLFRYKTDHHTRTPRGGNGDITGFSAGYRRRKGSKALDVVLKEQFLRKGEPLCCGSIRKTTFWRYSASLDRYFVLRSQVKYGKRIRP
jgi:hypothetical protein